MASKLVHRHSLIVRLSHWLSVIAVALLIGTGLNIFNAHPALYWGHKGTNIDTGARWLQIGAMRAPDGTLTGQTIIGTASFNTTGILGLSKTASAAPQMIAFPSWATLPSRRNLGLARNWHFFAAWLLVGTGTLYLTYGLLSGHLRRLIPTAKDLAPKNIAHDIKDHLRLHFPKGEAALSYQVLQKIAYAGVALILLPLMVLSGLGMSPGMDASWPVIVDAFGGRQSARSVHFIACTLILAFIAVHMLMLLAAGPFRLLRGMITGWQKVTT